MKKFSTKRTWMAIAAVVAAGLILGGLIVNRNQSATPRNGEKAENDVAAPQSVTGGESVKGPNGGKYFSTDGFGIEVTIFESGVPPRFRVYLSEHGKPLPPSAARVTVTLSRLGAPTEVFAFIPEAGYLLGDQVVVEPHSFAVAIAAERAGKSYRWHYSQVEARVAMSDAVLKSAGIEILTAGPATIVPTLKLPGEIAFNDERTVAVVPRVAGVVVAVNRDLGEQVKKGDVLAIIESQALADLRSRFAAARTRLALARTTFDREKALWEEKISARQDYLAAEYALSEAGIAADLAATSLRALGVPAGAMVRADNPARFEIRAPITGVIVEKAVATGEALAADADIFTVADLSTVWAQIVVYPKDLAVVRVGQRATIKATAFAAEGTGTVSHVGALVGEQTRTARARVTLSNPDGVWRPGMFVEVALVAEERRVPVAVSATAIQTVRGLPVVFGRYGDYLEARPLQLGRSDGRMVEVLGGLAAGAKYGAGNSFAIKADLGKAGATHDH